MRLATPDLLTKPSVPAYYDCRHNKNITVLAVRLSVRFATSFPPYRPEPEPTHQDGSD